MKTKNLKLTVAYWMFWISGILAFFVSGLWLFSAIHYFVAPENYDMLSLLPIDFKFIPIRETSMGTPLSDLHQWNVWWLLLQGMIGFFVFGLIFFLSKRIVWQIQRGIFFGREQVKWLNQIGTGFLILATLVFFVPDFTEAEGRIEFSLNFGYILAALFSFILAEIFQEGNRLNEESKLTV